MKTSKTRRFCLAVSTAAGMAVLLLSSAFWAPVARAEDKPEEKKPPSKSTPKNAPATKSGAPAGAPAPAGASTRPSSTPAANGPYRGPTQGAGASKGGPAEAHVTPATQGSHFPAGARTVATPGGGSVTRVNGRVADVHTPNGMDIHHGLNGRTTVVRQGPDGSRVVAVRGGYGYVQHPFVVRGNTFAARTYIVGGRPYQTFYRPYAFHGVALEVYTPARFYPIGFYGFVGAPFVAPVPYAWGWGIRTPWFGFYGGYFAPYPVYASPAFWLTDYLISQSLAAEYQAQMAAQAAAYPPPPPPGLPPGQVALTPDVKQAIADEVRRQMALENAEAQSNALNNDPNPASSGIARMFSDNNSHVFVVGDDLDLVDAGGQGCAVSQGDVLQLTQPPPPTASFATLVVMASKGGVECRKGSAVQVGLADLQNMQNHMHETLDQGLSDLQAHQGGLPAPPQQAMAMATPAVFMTGAPPPDQTVATQINQQYQQGTQAEQEVVGSGPAAAPAPAAGPGAPAGPPPTITLGQSIDQVVGMLGQPKNIVDLGAKKIYVYPDIKITFNNGTVADVE
jgi:hypothetical protein